MPTAPADTTATEVLHPDPVRSIIHTDIAVWVDIEGGWGVGEVPQNMYV